MRQTRFARAMKMIAARYMKHLVAVSLVLAFPLSSLAGGQEQTEWVLTQGGVVVPVARICAVEHSTGQSSPTGWRIITITSWVGGVRIFCGRRRSPPISSIAQTLCSRSLE